MSGPAYVCERCGATWSDRSDVSFCERRHDEPPPCQIVENALAVAAGPPPFSIRVAVTRFPNEAAGQLCTGIVVTIPRGLTYQQAKRFLIGAVAGEMERYAAAEILRGLGIKP